MATKLNEGTEVALPIKNIISMIVGAVVAAWAYFGIIERLNLVENTVSMHEMSIKANTKWTTGFSPPEAVQDTVKRVRSMELHIKELEMEVKHLKEK